MCKPFFTSAMAQGNVHHGRNLRKFREWRDMKQETLAYELGDDWTQKKISTLERKDVIEPVLLQQISQILKVPVELFDTVNDDPSINIIGNTFTASDNGVNAGITSGDNHNFISNPVEKWIEALAKNEALYERLLQSEKEKVELLTATLQKLEGLMKK
ncbi:helix-turn-helix transcriptional regulator [Chitinophagaceae bacterium MMS25-I14]